MLSSIITFLSGNKVIAGLLATVVASLFLRITSGIFFKVAIIALVAYAIGYLIGL